MRDRDFEAVADAGRELCRLAEDCACPELLQWARDALESAVARFDVRSPDDSAAAAIVSLAEGMIAVLEAAEGDFDLLESESEAA